MRPGPSQSVCGGTSCYCRMALREIVASALIKSFCRLAYEQKTDHCLSKKL